ncbi:NAD-dependent epimerase/dehydratase family protein (plasmid) [Nocardiopsis flavescens]|uniref:LooS9 n=1 Tax=Nocardiopsis flavescens TaxID=758803 RepID=A0A6M5K865_9ACTN|nr:LooS9 [Nocardiopsis flavescens]QKW32425.1 NAD-dependent epimerase/dehydratase family protein [Nocardiopsis flavescens]
MGRVVVTGAGGFIGSHLVDRLLEQGEDVVAFDVRPPEADTPAGRGEVRWVSGDVRDPNALSKVFAVGADVVYHLAAVVGVDRYLSRPLEVVETGVIGTRNVLAAAAEAEVARVVLASTSEVYGRNPRVPWREDDDRVLGPTMADRWTYSSAKALAEHTAFAWSRTVETELTVLRYFNVYGPRQRPAYVVSRNIHRVLNGKPPLVYDSGKQTRCFTYIQDAVTGSLRAAKEPAAAGQCYNIGSSVETTIGEAAARIAGAAGVHLPAQFVDTGRALGQGYEDIVRRVPDVSKARAHLGWSAATNFSEGLCETIAWGRANRWWLDLPESGGH